MLKELFHGKSVDEVPIGYITNGVHTPGWATAHAHDFWNKRLGFDWTAKLMEPKFWKKIADNELAVGDVAIEPTAAPEAGAAADGVRLV